MSSSQSCFTSTVGDPPEADIVQADYYLQLLVARRTIVETEASERSTELRNLPLSARNTERERNIRRVLQAKNREIATLEELCTALIQRIYQ